MTLVIVIVILENLAVIAAVIVVELISVITGVQVSIHISLPNLAQTCTPISCLKSSMSNIRVIDSGATDHMTEN